MLAEIASVNLLQPLVSTFWRHCFHAHLSLRTQKRKLFLQSQINSPLKGCWNVHLKVFEHLCHCHCNCVGHWWWVQRGQHLCCFCGLGDQQFCCMDMSFEETTRCNSSQQMLFLFQKITKWQSCQHHSNKKVRDKTLFQGLLDAVLYQRTSACLLLAQKLWKSLQTLTLDNQHCWMLSDSSIAKNCQLLTSWFIAWMNF